MKRLARRLLLILCVLLVAIQFVPVGRTNPPIDPAQTLEHTMTVPPDVKAILDRSCRDCHSNQTVWPWYSYVAPASWLLVHDVNHARDEMNFSEWGAENTDAQRDSLVEICRKVKKGAMPLGSYTFLHREAVLTPADVTALCKFTEEARELLKSRE
jgi:heme-binding protein